MSGTGPISQPFNFRTDSEPAKAVRKLVDVYEPSTWNKAWQASVTPWDAGEFQPPLKEVIETNIDGIQWPHRTGKALVPGCGTGYDAVYLASTLGVHAIGLDSSEIAVDKANASVKDRPLAKGKATFELADFFKYSSNEGFDLIYDYTFFVAIPPSRRNEWGEKMAELIKPGGYLITLIFPIDPKSDVGPPFYVRPEHYDEPLASYFEKVYERIPETSQESHKGRERVAVWRRKVE
ncbi:hypothetical protein Agabi119p4_9359 [Agaricus bisporus var. burnettii]|uniref:Thiol methyltransferase 1 n=1 Tax=Agaricus bisporus var. burnettii TaxID=192524 RepID=A0A8H7EWY6_AGABI|nr:hypothetical protein Agabi119p4_9359 [Agaricus bisporus var. burnettii]